MKKVLALTLAMAMALALAACGSTGGSSSGSGSAPAGSSAAGSAPAGEPVEITVFAAASMTETVDQIIEAYKTVAPNVTVIPTYESSGTLLTQIKEGADCDLFISAAQKQMNALDGSLKDDAEKNPDGLDMIDTTTRINLLENKVTLVVPEGNPKGIESFDQLAEHLKAGDILMAMGNSDVPVGQYTQKILAFYQLDEAALNTAGVLTYGSNVKEVTTQVSEASVDCGVIYATDAYSAGLAVVDSATAEMCGQVIYPAAVLSGSQHAAEAKAFLDYLSTPETMAIFEAVGFSAA
ncbi:molybdate ABC transporter substrate-binding protein [uncultured Oscillibacter sp.]|uniref:molybdate ABC transporter substrate-binding protein n=1 Tax=uncultured Oscillibacter sp. TaxID=876091 RepID=UPI0025EDF2B3|nr:molybdate ABC transporter substrate-binding protein [uncultured Oscillibacter sp.]